MIRLGVIYGGKSTENEISCKSAKYILENLDKNKYDIYPIYIDKSGEWYNEKSGEKLKIENIIKYLKELDIVFPILHGLYGEDGTIQGMFELFNIKYVGCGVLASSISMDKAYTKIIFEKAKILQTKYIYLKKCNKGEYLYFDENLNEKRYNINDIASKIEEKLKYPMFVKPSNSGSSVGISKIKDRTSLINGIENAGKYDEKILVEEGIIGKEVECAVLGNSKLGVIATEPRSNITIRGLLLI